MAFTTPKMSLRIWDQLADPYDHNQLADNWSKVDQHDHTPGRGVLIPTEGINDGAITTTKIADASITIAKLAAPSGQSFSAYRNSALSLATGAVVSFDTEEWDTSGWFDVTTHVGRFTPLVAGKYRLSSRIGSNVVLTSDVYWVTEIAKNGSAIKVGDTVFQRPGLSVGSSITTLVTANGTTDYFEVLLVHSTGGSAAINPSSSFTYFQGEYVGA